MWNVTDFPFSWITPPWALFGDSLRNSALCFLGVQDSREGLDGWDLHLCQWYAICPSVLGRLVRSVFPATASLSVSVPLALAGHGHCHGHGHGGPVGSACCFISEGRPAGCLRSCLWTWPPASAATSLCFQAVVAQLSAALKHCFRLGFNVLSQGFAWPPGGYLPRLSSALSSCLVFLWYPFSPAGCALGFIFWDWGFDTCNVTLRHRLVVDSLLFLPFCSLGSPGGTLANMCSVMYGPDTNLFLTGMEKGRMFLLWTGLPSSTLFENPCLSNSCSLDPVVLR